MKVKFFYANGTSYALRVLYYGLNIVSLDNSQVLTIGGYSVNPKDFRVATIGGLDGKTAAWDGRPQNDPFPYLLDPDIFDAIRITYPAASFPMGSSIGYGYDEIVSRVKNLTPGDPWMVGGYSQGAAVVSSVYNSTRLGGQLQDWAPGFLGGVCFGNPRRQVNYRGEVGGTWSGAWDVSGSTTGGHGSFPTTGPVARLTDCEPAKWIEFAAPGDIFTSTGDSTNGLNWTAGNAAFVTLAPDAIYDFLQNQPAYLAAANAAAIPGNVRESFVDAAGQPYDIVGGGHVTYPFVPPEGDPDSGKTSYQIALKWLTAKANAWATAPISLPASGVGWSTTLLSPAAS
ncbi:PE-PPE domain-containing protein [Mycolicibacterium helvum]|uniref:PE-PPE domain-containing protein n=1 Tax=Mycolicibacterium helvum TaxID=1534349 RepID=A0A7I7T987_9MYCO|nr:PE-PPE domain-containing protein [Mycolicibacterium helvum]BBY65019.1 hypothetical protein MHEL_32620 [Mycolicibacterium helvum]